MKKLAILTVLAALLPLGGCVVYGLGPSYGGAWANYDGSYEYGLGGYGPGGYCPPGLGDPYAYYGGYGGSGGYGSYGAYGGAGYGGYAGYGGPGYGVYGGGGYGGGYAGVYYRHR